MSPPPDSTLDDQQQTIADLMRQLAESNAERDEAQAQQAATAEVLEVINSSPGDLGPVFDAILDKAMGLCEAAHGHVWIYDGERAHPVAVRGEPQLVEWMRRVGSVGPFLGSSGRPSPLGRVVRGEPIAHVADALKEEAYRSVPVLRELVDVGGIRTILDIALRKGDAPLGIIALYRQEVRPFSDKQIALLQNFAAQAVIAIENARLLTETREALEQQTATAEVLQVINSSPGDLTPVFDAILEKAHRLCRTDFGGLQLQDGGKFRSVAERGLADLLAELLRRPFEPVPESPPARLLRGERIVHIADMAELARQGRDATRARAAAERGFRTGLFVPLRKDTGLLGYIVAVRREVRLYSEKEIALLENFAAQAVIAIENARLITETREALEQQTATSEVLQVINSSPGDLAPVFEAMLEKATRLCEAPFGTLRTWDGERFHFGAVYGDPQFSDWVRRRGSFHPDGGPSPLRRIMEGEQIVQVADVSNDAGYSTSPGFREMVEASGMRSVITVALRKDEALLGTIHVYRQEVRPFTDKQVALLENFAAQAVIAMENARLLDETRQRTEELQESLEYQIATSDVLKVISRSTFDLQPVLDTLCTTAARLCGAASARIALRHDESYRYVSSFATNSEWDAMVREMRFTASRGTVTGRALLERQAVHVADIATYPDHEVPETVTVGGVRTMLAVPLLREDEPIGVIALTRSKVDPFMERQIELVRTFADQAVIAIENARLITETREALEQQTATAEVLQVINSSPGDLAPVFDAMLEKATRLCEAQTGHLFRFENGAFCRAASLGIPEEFDRLLPLNTPMPDAMTRDSVVTRLLTSRAPVHVHDLREDESYRVRAPAEVAAVEEAGIRTGLIVPMLREADVVGAFLMHRQEVRPFTDKQIALLQNFAAQAVIAMENARLITETREALERQTATAEVLQVINSSPGNLAPVFQEIVDKAMQLCDAADGGLRTFDGELFHLVAIKGGDLDAVAQVQRIGPARPTGLFGLIARGERVIYVPDLRETDDYRDDPAVRARVDLLGIRTWLGVSLQREGVVLGAIMVNRREVRPFSDKQIALLQNFAAQAVIAMENARLLGELRQRTDEVGTLNRDLEARVAAQVDELGRVGRLKRFLAPQLAELIVSQGDEKILESHRREIVVVFCDLRGYTAFTETAEPEEVLDFLRQYHGALGPLVSQFEGTLDQFSGDGIMVFFNDPVPCPDPAERAVKMAVAMRSAASTLIVEWRERGRDLGFGAGIAQGYATLGQIGFSERSGYTAIGTVCNVAARLCAEAKDGQILLGQLVNVALKGSVATEQLGPLTLKGLSQPVVAYNVPLQAAQPALRVIEGGPQSV